MSFIQDTLRLHALNRNDLLTVPPELIIFDTNHYAPRLYQDYNIDFPKTLHDSIVSRQAEFLAGRICAQRVMHALGHTATTIGIGQQKEPLWPAGLVGSLSHTHNVATSVAQPGNRQSALGIDIERIRSGKTVDALVKRTMVAAEQRILAQSSLPFNTACTMLFSAKESFYKAFYPLVKQYFFFDTLQLVSLSNHACTVEVQRDIGDTLRAQQQYTIEFALVDIQGINHVCTLVIA